MSRAQATPRSVSPASLHCEMTRASAITRSFSALAPYLAPVRYVNYLEDDAVDPAAVAYGPNLRRLREIKTKYDPDNFFRQNVNILPAERD